MASSALIGRRVRIIGDHPHKGAIGTIDSDPKRVGGIPMVEIKLDVGWTEGCFAEAHNIQPLPKAEDPNA